MAQSLLISGLKWIVMFSLWVVIEEQEFYSIVLLIMFLCLSGLELYAYGMFMVASIFLLGLLGGMVVFTSFMIKMCSSSRIQLPLRLKLGGHMSIAGILFLLYCWDYSVPFVPIPMWSSPSLFQSHLSLYLFLIGLLMIMLFLIEEMTTLKSKGMISCV